ncbi:hypothetical protein [Ekhidna sp.]|uniref:hypothetical protein n=1 Tax=Ekhidna sp. TaxID=2608089 RepID=UPI0032F00D72
MTSSDIYWIFADLNRYSGVPGVLFFLFFIRQWKSNAAIIFYILFVSFIFDFSIYIYIKHFYPNSYIGSNWWVIVNYGLMSWFFVRVLPRLKKVITVLAIIFALTAIISFGFFMTFLESNTITWVFSSAVFLTLSILGFKEILNKPKGELLKMPVFYALTALFTYYALTFLKGLFMQYLVFELEITSSQLFPVNMVNLFANTSKNYILFFAMVLLHKGVYDPILNPKTNGK